MSEEPSMTPREKTEVRLTALLLGELSAEEAAALRTEMAWDPELAALYARLQRAMELLREVNALPEEPPAPAPLQLSAERRERLLAHFKTPPSSEPATKLAPIIELPKHRDWSWVGTMGIAAGLIALLGGSLWITGSFVGPRTYQEPPDFVSESSYVAASKEPPPASAPGGWVGQPGMVRVYRTQDESNGKPKAGAQGTPIPSLSWAMKNVASDASGSMDRDSDANSTVERFKRDTGTVALGNGSLTTAAPAPRSNVNSSTLTLTGSNAPTGAPAFGDTISPAGQPAQLDMFGSYTDTSKTQSSVNGPAALGTFETHAFLGASAAPAAPVAPPMSGLIAGTGGTEITANKPVVLGDIPILGRAFQSDGSTRTDLSRLAGTADGPQSGEIVTRGIEIGKDKSQPMVSTKSGAGTFELAGNNTYTGGVTITAGTMVINGTSGAAGGGGVASTDRGTLPLNGGAFGGGAYGTDGGATRATVGGVVAGGKLAANAATSAPESQTQPMARGDINGEGFINYGSPIPSTTPPPPPINEPIFRMATQALKMPTAKPADGANPIIGRVQVWSDDETTKANVPTAGQSPVAQNATENAAGEKANRDLVLQGRVGNESLAALSSDLRQMQEKQVEAKPSPASEEAPSPKADTRMGRASEAEVVELDAKMKAAPDPRSAALEDAEQAKTVDGVVALEIRRRESHSMTVENGRDKLAKGSKEAAAAPAAEPKPAAAFKPLFKSVDEQLLVQDGETKQVAGKLERAPAEPAAAAAAQPPLEVAKLEVKKAQPVAKELKDADDRRDEARKVAETPPPVPQPEVATSANAFSTFSLNVSDVAFKLAAASLDQGRMPEVGTVRSEEFINAFDYHDPEPAPGNPLTCATECARYPYAQNRDLLRLSVKTAAAGRQAGRPLNLVLLLDNSGSMERADRVRILHEALRVLSAQLQPQDKLSVITFARTPRLWAEAVAGDKAAEVTSRVGEITPEGGTNLSAALDLGYTTALRHFQPGNISRVVLLTDGAANLGNVDPEALKKKVENFRRQGVALDCFGIGWEGYDDTVLEALSRNGDGRYGFINSPEEAATEFAGQLAGALRVAASDVKVQVEFNPRRVTAYRQIGYAKHQLTKEQFRDNTVDAAEIGAAESGNALYVIEVNPRGEGDLATLRVRFKVPGTSDYKEHEWPVPFNAATPPLAQASPALRLAGTASAFSEWLVSSPYATEVTPDNLLALLNGVPATYQADPRPKKLETMIRQAKSVSGR